MANVYGSYYPPGADSGSEEKPWDYELRCPKCFCLVSILEDIGNDGYCASCYEDIFGKDPVEPVQAEQEVESEE